MENLKTYSALLLFFGMMMAVESCRGESADLEQNIILYGMSKHIKSSTDSYKYNERNPSLGFEVISGSHGVTIGKYKDSYSTTAKYIAGLYLPYRSSHTKLGLMYGAVRSPSYSEKAGRKYIPMMLPYLSVNTDAGLGLNILYLPKFTSNGAHVLGFQFKFRLN